MREYKLEITTTWRDGTSLDSTVLTCAESEQIAIARVCEDGNVTVHKVTDLGEVPCKPSPTLKIPPSQWF
jgi:hypothetical protein